MMQEVALSMFGNKHLHIDENDVISDWLVKAMKSVTHGTIAIDTENQLVAHIDISKDKIAINLLQPEFFRAPDDETGLSDKVQTSREFSRKLTHNGMTLTILTRSHGGLTLRNEAKPT